MERLYRKVKLLLGVNVGDKVDHTVGVSPLVIVPGDNLDEVVVQSNTSLSINNGRKRASPEVGGDNKIVGVAQNTLHGTLRSLLQSSHNVSVSGTLLETDSQIDARDIRGGDTESHTSQLAVKAREDLTDSLGGTSGSRDDVVHAGTAITPALAGGTVNRLLGGGGGVDGGHQTFNDTVLLVEDLGEGSETVGGARGVGDNVHVLGVLLLVDTHDEHRGISRGGRDDDLLGTTLQMFGSLLGDGEDTSGLNNVGGTSSSPGDGSGVTLGEDRDGLSVDDQLAVLGLDITVPPAVGGVVLEHVDHVVKSHEGVVDGDDVDLAAGNGGTGHEATNTTEAVDTDGGESRHSCLCVMGKKKR